MTRRPAARFLALRLSRSLFVAALVAGGPWAAGAQTTTASTPQRSARVAARGLDPARLARLDAVLQRYVDEKRVAGLVSFVLRDGQVAHLKAFGQRDVERAVPMTTDTLFRIASMSKAVTSVGVMMLQEEGRLLLSDPVSKFLPAYAKTTVAVPLPAGAPTGSRPGVVPAKRQITIRDLLTHTAGISYGNGNPAEADYRAAGLLGWYFADKDEPIAAPIDRLAALPFDAQPGEKYVYGYSTDILGRVVEVASGLSLDEFFAKRIFAPLKMRDTFFFVPREQAARLATVYAAKADGTIERAPDPGRGQGDYVEGPRKCFSGGAGLVSTAHDYARLLQMLLDDGTLDGARLLSPASVALMTSNHVGALYSDGSAGFGLGFEIVEHLGRTGRLASVGEYGWGGAYHTRYWVDPQNGVVGVLMTQLLPAGSSTLLNTHRAMIYQAITER
jgi:CubicO group peptidase (beta-lactamase class C family)